MLNLFAAYLSISVVVNQGRQKLRVGRKAFIASTQLLDCSSHQRELARTCSNWAGCRDGGTDFRIPVISKVSGKF